MFLKSFLSEIFVAYRKTVVASASNSSAFRFSDLKNGYTLNIMHLPCMPYKLLLEYFQQTIKN